MTNENSADGEEIAKLDELVDASMRRDRQGASFSTERSFAQIATEQACGGQWQQFG